MVGGRLLLLVALSLLCIIVRIMRMRWKRTKNQKNKWHVTTDGDRPSETN
jgi:hypothetical protein